MLKHPKAKGNRFENEIVKQLKSSGFDAERMWGSNGASRGLPEEVDIVVKYDIDGSKDPDTHMWIQCKFTAKLAAKFKPSDKIDATIFRENHGESYIMLKLDTFIERFMK